MRLDLLEVMRGTGEGWQTRANEALRSVFLVRSRPHRPNSESARPDDSATRKNGACGRGETLRGSPAQLAGRARSVKFR